MSKHRQQRPTIQLKWWTRYALYLATTLLIKATTNTNRTNKQQMKHQTKN